MTERLIPPEEYTPEINAAIAEIRYRMDYTLTSYNEDTIVVFEHDGKIYVLGNPILGEELVINSDGILESVPLYNLTIQHDGNWINPGWENGKYKVTVKQPRLRILRPDLCKRIEMV